MAEALVAVEAGAKNVMGNRCRPAAKTAKLLRKANADCCDIFNIPLYFQINDKRGPIFSAHK